MNRNATHQALAGVRVLDLTRLLPGPYTSYILVGYGADVIKVEDTGAGDYARNSSPLKCSGMGVAFTSSNAGKRSIAIDLKSDAGRETLLCLVREADVLVESFRPGVMQRLGLDYDTLRVVRPELVYCSITGYGQRTPRAHLAGHDINYQGVAGLLSQRTPATAQSLPPALLGDLVGGSYSAVISIMAALLQRRVTGLGSYLDISITHGALALLPMVTIAAANDRQAPAFGRTALTGANLAYAVYAAADGRYITLGALEHKFWHAFCTHAGLDDLADLAIENLRPDTDAPLYITVRQRLIDLFKTKTAHEWVALGEQWDVCLGMVASADESIEEFRSQDLPVCHHFPSRGVDSQDATVHAIKGVSADLASSAMALTPPPLQGEHTGEILRHAGFSEDEIRSLHDRKIVKSVAP